MIYYHAYKEAALDEEKLLQQKTKIQWLREGDFNSAFIHNYVKGRTSRNIIEMVYDAQGNAVYGDSIFNMFVSHFESFLGTQDDVYPIEDPGSLFLKKLDMDKAINLIRPVADNEVKDAMFGIDDDKAAGPDGYSTKSKIAKNYAFKIDVQKAYDTVSWDFLDFWHREFGFHQDMIFASILRRGLDEFSMSSGLYPSEAKSEAFFSGLTPEVKEEIKLVMPFREGTLPIRYLGVPLSSKNINKNDYRVLLEAVHNKGGPGLRPLHDWNEALMAKNLWSIASNKDSIWVKWLLRLRDKIRNFVNVKIGNGKDCSCWFNKWHTSGPLNKLINHMIILDARLSLSVRVCDVIDNGIWRWPTDWLSRFSEVLNVLVPAINNDLCDKVVWIDKKGRERILRSENESHSHLFFSCAYSKKLWERLKPMAMMENMSNVSLSVVSSIVNKTANNSIWSVIERLVFGATIYSLWLERNSRIYNQIDRTVDSIFKQVVSTVRLKHRGLVFKSSPDVLKAFEIWNFPIGKSSYYSNIVRDLLNDMYDDLPL
uniref:RNA-directed DNA polymerase, eukaryota, reverse transcriptase zinc-binding domain protein n=1 Tax=Tanacetum cinerariifolium TaxID=118510 RepID=A0A6L2MLI9_TANCI|nr:hypothetical protein [Tanacetum cinerariifolium]